jgi:hypothetical protein
LKEILFDECGNFVCAPGTPVSQEDSLLWLIVHTEIFFPVLVVGLIMLAEFGFRIRRAFPETSGGIQSVIESARDGLSVLLGLLLGFSLPTSLPAAGQLSDLIEQRLAAASG